MGGSIRKKEPVGGSLLKGVLFLAFYFYTSVLFAVDTVLVIHNRNIARPAQSVYSDAMAGIKEDLEEFVNVFDFAVEVDTSFEDTRAHLFAINPDLVILMGNRAINTYRLYQNQSGLTDFPPAVVLMEVFVARDLARLQNAVGIEYQVQGVTSLNHFRKIFPGFDRVGVVYRDETLSFLYDQKAQCEKEDVELIGIMVGKNGTITPRQVRSALKKLARKEKVQAVWVLNDSVLLTPKLLREAWMRTLKRYDLPTIVGIQRFFAEDEFTSLGHFAVVPDPHGVGRQAAGLVLDIRAKKWQINDKEIFTPFSIHKFLHRGKLSASLDAKLNEDKLLELDKVLD